MPRSPARYTQADLARAIRAMKQAFGSATVIFETDGRVRITADSNVTAAVKLAEEEKIPIDLGPWIPEPIRTLSEADVKQQMGKFPHRSRDWILSIPKQAFHGREIDTLEQLTRCGVGVPVRLVTIRGCGPETAQKLSIRGYVDIAYQKSAPDQIETLSLTAAGAKAVKPPGSSRPKWGL